MNKIATPIDDFAARLGECPTWDHRAGVLYWADIEGLRIHRLDPETGERATVETAGRPGSFVLTSSHDVLLVAMEHELVWLHIPTGTTESFVTLEEEGNGNRLNDGKTDWAGRYVVGSMYENPNDGRATGSLYSVDADGSHRTLRTGIGVSNGLGFDPDRERMYFADTHTRTVQWYRYDPTTGTVSEEHLFFDYGELPGLPDGACVDSEGFYWSASVYGWAVIRISPDGEVVQQVETPVEKPSMPAFGGAALDTMFISTIGMGGAKPSAEGKDGAVPGSMLSVAPGVMGRREVPFAGVPPTFA